MGDNNSRLSELERWLETPPTAEELAELDDRIARLRSELDRWVTLRRLIAPRPPAAPAPSLTSSDPLAERRLKVRERTERIAALLRDEGPQRVRDISDRIGLAYQDVWNALNSDARFRRTAPGSGVYTLVTETDQCQR